MSLSTPTTQQQEKVKPNVSVAVAKELTAGSIAGMSATMIGHPLDTVKVRLQTQAHMFRSGFHCFTSMLRNEGSSSLFRGLSSPMYSCILYNCLQFGLLGSLKRWIARGKEPTILHNAMAGSLSGIAVSLYQTPIDQVKTMLQTQQKLQNGTVYRGPSDLMVNIFRNECNRNPIRFYASMMRAYPAAFSREFYGCAVYFGFYAFMKEALAKTFVPEGSDRRKLTSVDFMLSGSASGVTYWSLVYPVDVVKSRMHVCQKGEYTGTIQGIRKILKQEGRQALYFGYHTTVARSICTSGVLFLCYEKVLDYLGR